MTPQKALPVRRWSAALVVVAALAGCSTRASATDPTPASNGPPKTSSAPAQERAHSASATPSRPSPAALMVCDTEIRSDVRTLFRLRKDPAPQASWHGGIYQCRYPLPHGQLTISVSEDGTHRGALKRFAAARQHATKPRTISGLASFGLPAFETPDGIVMFAKDDKTLTVDARGLPASGSPDRQSRGALAYQIASDILSCWNE